MFFCTQGDVGPRVVLVQSLLRLNGYDVRVTGHWNPETEKAAAQFRQAMGLSAAHGPVNSPVFARLIKNQRLKYVCSIDASAGWAGYYAYKGMKSEGVAPVLNQRVKHHGIEEAVKNIYTRAGDHKIALLSIHGHGNHGTWICMALGDPVGTLEDQSVSATQAKRNYQNLREDWQSYINLEHFETHRKVLGKLAPYFAKFGSVEVHSCKIAAQKRLLRVLSDTFEVPVTGGWDNQHTVGAYYNERNEKIDYLSNFNGAVFTAYPHGGNLASWAADVEGTVVIKQLTDPLVNWGQKVAKGTQR